jgi:hypothetical protein
VPIEVLWLEGTRVPISSCPKCHANPFRPFLRGQVQRGAFGMLFAWLRGKPDWRRYCALICWECKDIVGYE